MSEQASNTRLGLIGFGHMGTRLADYARKLGMSVDIILDSRDTPFGLSEHPYLSSKLTRDPEAFWSRDVDVTVIATHGPSHAPLLEEGLARGRRRFFVEKPFATGVAEARAAKALADTKGARVVVNHNRRYCPSYEKLASLDGSPELGSLRSILFSLGGGGLGCLGTHYFDLCNMLFGACPETVIAEPTEPLGPNPRGAEFHDPGASVFLTYPGGRRAFLDIGDDFGVPHRMELVYTTGRVVIERELTEPWRVMARPEAKRADSMMRRSPLEQVMSIAPHSMADTTSLALRDCLADSPPRSGTANAIASLEVFAAARWSASRRERVSSPLPAKAADQSYPIP